MSLRRRRTSSAVLVSAALEKCPAGANSPFLMSVFSRVHKQIKLPLLKSRGKPTADENMEFPAEMQSSAEDRLSPAAVDSPMSPVQVSTGEPIVDQLSEMLRGRQILSYEDVLRVQAAFRRNRSRSDDGEAADPTVEDPVPPAPSGEVPEVETVPQCATLRDWLLSSPSAAYKATSKSRAFQSCAAMLFSVGVIVCGGLREEVKREVLRWASTVLGDEYGARDTPQGEEGEAAAAVEAAPQKAVATGAEESVYVTMHSPSGGRESSFALPPQILASFPSHLLLSSMQSHLSNHFGMRDVNDLEIRVSGILSSLAVNESGMSISAPPSPWPESHAVRCYVALFAGDSLSDYLRFHESRDLRRQEKSAGKGAGRLTKVHLPSMSAILAWSNHPCEIQPFGRNSFFSASSSFDDPRTEDGNHFVSPMSPASSLNHSFSDSADGEDFLLVIVDARNPKEKSVGFSSVDVIECEVIVDDAHMKMFLGSPVSGPQLKKRVSLYEQERSEIPRSQYRSLDEQQIRELMESENVRKLSDIDDSDGDEGGAFAPDWGSGAEETNVKDLLAKKFLNEEEDELEEVDKSLSASTTSSPKGRAAEGNGAVGSTHGPYRCPLTGSRLFGSSS